MLLLTWHGTLVCLRQNGGGLVHLPIGPQAPDTVQLELEIGRAPPAAPLRVQSVLGPLVVAGVANARISVARYGQYLTANPQGAALAFDAAEADIWESFLPITGEDLGVLAELAGAQWIDRNSRRVLRRGSVTILEDFRLDVAGIVLDLEAGWPVRIRPEAASAGFLLTFGGGETMELVPAAPRSSVLLDTLPWPPRARRVAEIVVLAAHRQVALIEPEQDVFEQDVAALLAGGGPQALDPLLARLLDERQSAAPAAASGTPDTPDVDDVLRSWALAQTARWAPRSIDPRVAEALHDDLNVNTRYTFLFRIADGTARMEDKPEAARALDVEIERARRYLRLLQAVALRLPPEFSATLSISVDDLVDGTGDVPVFGFQKGPGERSLLLPDVDLLDHDFFEDGDLDDLTGYFDKVPAAVFAGATSGGTITAAVARNLDLPRLRAAAFFNGHDKVDFRLPSIVQCTGDAENILRAQPFCQRPRLSWEEQMRSRLLISMDGNGATCARVAIALRSNAALLKYDSPASLFYFPGLLPWLHYVPVSRDEDVDTILALEDSAPDTFARIAENGRRFALTYLTRDAAERYTAFLLQHYAGLFQEVSEAPIATQRGTAGSSTALLVHMQERADVEGPAGEWLGEPGSGLAIEGLAIFFGADTPWQDLTYQAVLPGGRRSAMAVDSEFVGSRGRGLPLRGFCIFVAEGAAGQVDIAYEASFIDGSRAGPFAPGTDCVSPTGAPLEAVRLDVGGQRAAEAIEATQDAKPLVVAATGAFGRARPVPGTKAEALMEAANAALADYVATTALQESFRFAFQENGPLPAPSAVVDISDEAAVIRMDPTVAEPWTPLWRAMSLITVMEAMLAWAPLPPRRFLVELGDGSIRPDAASFCSNNPNAFLLPDPDFIGSAGYNADRLELARRPPLPWAERRPVAFWRGVTTGIRRHPPPPQGAPDNFTWLPRLDLCRRARRSKLADSYDVGITKFVHLNDPALHARIEAADLTRPAAGRAAFAQCKAILVIDGNSNPWSALFLALLSGACVLRVEPAQGFRQWYYAELKPWVNYVPIRSDLSDMDDAVAWVLGNDDAARQIAAAGQVLANAMTFESVVDDAARRLRAWLEA